MSFIIAVLYPDAGALSSSFAGKVSRCSMIRKLSRIFSDEYAPGVYRHSQKFTLI